MRLAPEVGLDVARGSFTHLADLASLHLNFTDKNVLKSA